MARIRQRTTSRARTLQPFIADIAGGVATETIIQTGMVEEGPGIDVVEGAESYIVGRGEDSILVSFADGSPAAEYPATDVGLDAASAVAGAATITIPACAVLTADHTLTSNVAYIFDPQATVSGQIQLSAGTEVHNLHLARAANDGSDLRGVRRPASGAAYLFNCVIVSVQSGAGRGLAVSD